MRQPSTRGSVFRNGLIFGAIIAAIGMVSVLINWQLGAYNVATQTATGSSTSNLFGPSLFIGCGIFIVDLALMFVAGMLTARATGSVGAGSLTGLVAGLVGALVGSGIGIVLIITVITPQIQIPTGSPFTQSQMQGIIIGGAILGLVGGLILDSGFGAGMGALGGVVGSNSYERAHPPQPYQESFYPGAMGQPGAYPPPPPYAMPLYPPQSPPPYAGQPGYPPTPEAPQQPPQPPQQS